MTREKERYVGDGSVFEARRRGVFDRAFFKAVIDFAALSPGDRVLDLGTGGGFLARGLARERPLRMTGLDLGPAAVAYAREQVIEEGHRWMDFVAGDAARVPLKPRSFDAIVMLTLLCVVPKASAVLDEALALLRPGGTLVAIEWAGPGAFADPADPEHEARVREHAAAQTAAFNHRFGADHLLGPSLPGLFRAAGFGDVRWQGRLPTFSPADRSIPLADRVRFLREDLADLGRLDRASLVAVGMPDKSIEAYVAARKRALDPLLADPREATLSKATWVRTYPLMMVAGKR